MTKQKKMTQVPEDLQHLLHKNPGKRIGAEYIYA